MQTVQLTHHLASYPCESPPIAAQQYMNIASLQAVSYLGCFLFAYHSSCQSTTWTQLLCMLM